jgi:hypothetical protein
VSADDLVAALSRLAVVKAAVVADHRPGLVPDEPYPQTGTSRSPTTDRASCSSYVLTAFVPVRSNLPARLHPRRLSRHLRVVGGIIHLDRIRVPQLQQLIERVMLIVETLPRVTPV